MSGKHLSKRANWQAGARVTGDKGEKTFLKKLRKALPKHYEIRSQPILEVIKNKRIRLDGAVTNTKTGKSIFIECKTGTQGGNAHERVYKFASPKLKRAVRKKYNTADEPFFLVFAGRTFFGKSFYIERKNKKTGKKTRTLVDPSKYQAEMKVLLERKNYAIMKPRYENIAEVAKRIMERI